MIRYVMLIATLILFVSPVDVLANGPDRDALMQQLAELAATGQPEGENGFSRIIAIAKRIHEIEKKEEQKYFDQHGEWPVAYYGSLYATPGHVAPDFDMDVRDRSYTESIILPRLRDEGIFDQLRVALSHPRFVAVFDGDGTFDGFAEVRQVVKAAAADAAIAAKNDDFKIVQERLKQIQQLSRIAEMQSVPLAMLVSHAIDALFVELCVHIAQLPNVDLQILNSMLDSVVDEFQIEEQRIERAAVLEVLAAFSKAYDADGNLDQEYVNRSREQLERAKDLFPVDDIARDEELLPNLPDTWDQCVADARTIFGSMIDRTLSADHRSRKRSAMGAHGCKLIIAVRLYELNSGELPDKLTDVTPGILESLPTDPINGKPFGYRTLLDDPFGRPFIIYSFGADGIDNDGLQEPGSIYRALDEDYPGFDYPINDVIHRN